MTTTQNHDVINYCEHCELVYVAHWCAPCPLCPMREKLNAANREVFDSEPWQIASGGTAAEIQETMNEMAAAGWELHKNSFGYVRYEDVEESEFVALMIRRNYDQERHEAAEAGRQDLLLQYHAIRQQIRQKTQEFRAARDGESCA
ncbi:MAG: hypothetical protein OXE87_10885 [Chloroflexi bacterium]|nr:hypothetical protein [Chloroflexota bacterium]